MWRCEKCDELRLDRIKKCYCKEFTIEYEGEPYTQHATDSQCAALAWAEYWNQDDCPLLDAEVTINVSCEGVTKMYTVGAEADIHYHAKETEPDYQPGE